MSDTQQGPDWWLGADGKWYPPVAKATDVPREDLSNTTLDAIIESSSKSNKRSTIGLAVIGVVVVGVVAILLTRDSDSSQRRINGDLTLQDISAYLGQAQTEGSPCEGHGGYDDLSGGAQVIVKDRSGNILASGRLDEGQLAKVATLRMGLKENDACRFHFALSVPDEDFYSVEVSHRGAQTYARSDLEQAGWQVHLTLGG